MTCVLNLYAAFVSTSACDSQAVGSIAGFTSADVGAGAGASVSWSANQKGPFISETMDFNVNSLSSVITFTKQRFSFRKMDNT